MNVYLKETLCFGLDIGTRTVIGVVGYREGSEFILVDYECRAHEERAMMDGQIHDIQKVSHIVYEVKRALEQRLGTVFKEVAVAAAGRTLSTQIAEVTHVFSEPREITLADIHHLELEGVETAKAQQNSISQETDYYCVAYSVVQYYLDEYVIANLEGHKGRQISAKLIATFLPKQVIDSLYAVTERAELTVSHLTLEPIAAINAIIPEQMRLLNLALVDMGAGTSDIAITKEGSIVAYGMIPNAGDEVTEAIVHTYLVDFNTAETIKKQVFTNDEIHFTDIIGLSHQITSEEVRAVIDPVIDTMAQQIADCILELNGGRSPNAVFCVGGSSQMPELISKLSTYLGVIKERVAVRSTAHLTHFKDEVGLIESPEVITPLGICMTMIQDKYSQFTFVKVNDQKVQLLNAKKLTVLDAIIAVGIEHHTIFPKKGSTLMFKLNGERQRIKGENGIPATLLLNGKAASIQDPIREGDVIHVEPALPGTSPYVRIGDFVESKMFIKLDGQVYDLPLVQANGKWVTKETIILEQDEITTFPVDTVKELLTTLNVVPPYQVTTADFKEVTLEHLLQNGDSFLLHQRSESYNEAFSSETHLLAKEPPIEVVDSVTTPSKTIGVMVNNEPVYLPEKESGYILAGIFDFIEFDLSRPQGTIQLIRNGVSGGLADPIEEGDHLEIYWKK